MRLGTQAPPKRPGLIHPRAGWNKREVPRRRPLRPFAGAHLGAESGSDRDGKVAPAPVVDFKGSVGLLQPTPYTFFALLFAFACFFKSPQLGTNTRNP
jgi:hypothetical protein